jgi:hypothetical protein
MIGGGIGDQSRRYGIKPDDFFATQGGWNRL